MELKGTCSAPKESWAFRVRDLCCCTKANVPRIRSLRTFSKRNRKRAHKVSTNTPLEHLQGMFHVKHSLQLPNSMEAQRSITPISRPCASKRIHLRHVPNHENSALAFSTPLSYAFLQKTLLKTQKRPAAGRRPLRNARDTRSNRSEPVRLSYVKSELDQASAQLGK